MHVSDTLTYFTYISTGSKHRTSAPRPHKLPIGVLIAIVVAIALVIGSLILTIGIVCLKRSVSARALICHISTLVLTVKLAN